MKQARLVCKCGYQGAIRLEDNTGKCIGCDKLYQINDEGELMEMPNEMPEFKSWDDLMKFNKKTQGGKVRKPRSRTKKPKPAPTEQAHFQEIDPEKIFFTVNFYMRPEQDWNSLLRMAKEERNNRGQTVAVSVHNHILSKDCTHLCHSIPVGES